MEIKEYVGQYEKIVAYNMKFEYQNPMEGKRVVFVEDSRDKENAR